MANAELITTVITELNFAVNEYVVFGGACLALRNLREARDVELFVNPGVTASLVTSELWGSAYFAGRNRHLVGQVAGMEVQLFDGWDNDTWRPDIEAYFRSPEFVRGIPCMPLAQIREWKRTTARPKDLRDIELIDEYLKR